MKRSLLLLSICVVVAAIVWSQVPEPAKPAPTEAVPQPPVNVPQTSAAQMTTADVDAFLEGIVPLQLERENIAGAAVAVVKDGKVLFSKGYGYADREKKVPVSADETLFRPGSVSKLFTWTAVMQLAEQGKLDLNRDVNEYLDFKIPEAFGKPITLKDILTHTPGFDEQIKDLFAPTSESPNLDDYIKTHLPARIYPPATTPSYSNYGTALAGYIVERVSGKPFNDYVNDHIFKPLEMGNSTFAQPLPAELASKMSKGYRLASDEPVPFETISAYPAGSLSSSAGDMTKFMIAHLNGGQGILKPETTRLMHSRLFALDDAALAMAHGFYEENRNGQRIVGHGGDTIAFHSDLHLMLDAGVGFFISYNSLGKGEANSRAIIWKAFLDRYFPYKKEAAAIGSAKDDSQSVAGNYMISRRSDTSFFRAAAILGEATVVPNEDGTISVAALTDPSGQPIKFQEVAPMRFQDVNGEDTLIFKPDAEGAMQMILPYPFMVFKRVGISENSRILLPVLGLSLGIMALTLLLAPVAWLVRRHYERKLDLTQLERLLRRSIWIVFLLDLICVIGLTSLITYGLTHIEVFSESRKIWFYLFQGIGILGALGTVVVLFNAVHAWMSNRFRIWGKLQATLLVLACFGFLWFAFVCNLLVFRSSY